MKFLKSNHKLVGQNEQFVKKSHKHETTLRNNSTLYFQGGLILTLLASYGLLEMNFRSESFKFVSPLTDDTEVVYFVNIVPETIPEPVTEKKAEPVRKKLLAIKFVPVKNPTIIPEKLKPMGAYSSPTITIPKEKKIVSTKPRTMIDVEKVPIYPGCEGLTTNVELSQCMSKKNR